MKAVFFDWDGTLVDSLPMLFKAHNHVRSYMNVPLWTRDEYAQAIVYSSRELYPRLYGERSEEARGVLISYINEHHLKELSVLEGAKDILDMLSARGVPMGIVSNKTHEVLRREVEHLGWQDYFGVYNGAGQTALDKPSGLPLRHAVELHPDVDSLDNVLYVGDMESDLGCGTDAGCRVLFIRHVANSDELIAKYKPAYVVTNLAEAKEKLMEFLAEPLKKKA